MSIEIDAFDYRGFDVEWTGWQEPSPPFSKTFVGQWAAHCGNIYLYANARQSKEGGDRLRAKDDIMRRIDYVLDTAKERDYYKVEVVR